MGWLVSIVMMSAGGSYLVTRIYDVFFGGIVGPLAVAAKNSLFVGTWVSITTGLGIRDAKKAAGKLRGKGVGTPIENPLKRKRLK